MKKKQVIVKKNRLATYVFQITVMSMLITLHGTADVQLCGTCEGIRCRGRATDQNASSDVLTAPRNVQTIIHILYTPGVSLPENMQE